MRYPCVIRSKHFPPKPFGGISLFGLIIFREDNWVTPREVRHELIHFRQQLEWLFFPFFLLYVLEFLWHYARLRHWGRAYMAISFEREAYLNDHKEDYLRHRPLWANYRKLKK